MTFPYEWTIARQSSPILPIYVGLLVLFSLFLGRIAMHDTAYRVGQKRGHRLMTIITSKLNRLKNFHWKKQRIKLFFDPIRTL